MAWCNPNHRCSPLPPQSCQCYPEIHPVGCPYKSPFHCVYNCGLKRVSFWDIFLLQMFNSSVITLLVSPRNLAPRSPLLHSLCICPSFRKENLPVLFFSYHKTKLGVEDGGNTDLITLQERLKFLQMNGLQKAKVHLLKTWKKSMLRQERLKQPSAWYGGAVAKYGDKEGTRHCQTSGFFFSV